MRRSLLILLLFITGGVSAQSKPLRLAVAANAQFVIKALQDDFKKKTGIETEAIIGSSGNLSAQIKNGAPFDMFLSADMDFPNTLFKEGLATAKPTEYALGSLIVCTRENLQLNDWRTLLAGDAVKKIAVANPALAPYGKAAKEALEHYGIWDKLLAKMVFGESISQVNTYITTGAVSVGFTTEALIYEYPGKDKLKWVKVDEKVYGKIRQGMIILNYSRKGNYEKATKFFNYVLSADARQLLKKFGYRLS